MASDVAIALLLFTIAQAHLFDYIVIGGGTTGSVVATRLAEAKYNVLLIEAGFDDLTYSCKFSKNNCNSQPFGDFIAGTPLIPMKNHWWMEKVKDLRWNMISKPAYWNFNKTSIKFRFDLIRGKLLGGCSSLNGQKWTRGSVRDFDYIAEKYNLPNWSFQNVLPYFQKCETYLGKNKTMRGQNGPIQIMENNLQKHQYVLSKILHSSIQSGLPLNDHINGDGKQTGIHLTQKNMAQYKNGKHGLFDTKYYRSSSSQAYIREIGIYSCYLTVWCNTTVQRILFDENRNAIGVDYYDKNGKINSIFVEKEIILSTGVFQSPVILMVSGIGPHDELNKFNIKPIHIHNSIGRFGQDHSKLTFKLKINASYFNMSYFNNYKETTIYNYINYENKDLMRKRQKQKKMTFNFERGSLGIYISSNKYDRLGLDYNDIKIDIQELSMDEIQINIDPSVYSKNLTVLLNDIDSRIYPNIYQNFYVNSKDYDLMISGILALRKILEPIKHIFIDDIYSILGTIDRDYIWKHSRPTSHVVGTISMGSNSTFPVDTNCLLRGVNHLRIVDPSIWPESTNAGTQSLAYLIGEKCSQHIIESDIKVIKPIIWINQNNILLKSIVIVIVIIFCGFFRAKLFKHTILKSLMILSKRYFIVTGFLLCLLCFHNLFVFEFINDTVISIKHNDTIQKENDVEYTNIILSLIPYNANNRLKVYSLINSILINSNDSNSMIYFHILVAKQSESILIENEFYLLFDHFNENVKLEIKSFDVFLDNSISQLYNLYFDIFLPEFFNLKKAIFINTKNDIIVQTDISKLYKYSIVDYQFWFVFPSQNELYNEFQTNIGGFNTDIYLFDAHFWRENNITKKCQNILMNYSQTNVLNIVFTHLKNINIGHLDSKWYQLISNDDDPKTLTGNKILRWVGTNQQKLQSKFWSKYIPDRFESGI